MEKITKAINDLIKTKFDSHSDAKVMVLIKQDELESIMEQANNDNN